MNLPEENATAEEMRRFAAGLSTARRMRLAAALIYPEIEEIEANDAEMTDDAKTAGRVFADEIESDRDDAFEAFVDFIYRRI
ncbi:MAG: hypothetical protein M0R28_20300 [Pigmentiphaga sp.]|nr:hypothetical protein [Pigmentiphaga sp.]